MILKKNIEIPANLASFEVFVCELLSLLDLCLSPTVLTLSASDLDLLSFVLHLSFCFLSGLSCFLEVDDSVVCFDLESLFEVGSFEVDCLFVLLSSDLRDDLDL